MSWSFDPESTRRLSDFLRSHDLGSDEPAIRPIGEGHSNLTFRIDVGGRSLVLRRPPPPPLPPGSNDVLREAGFLRAVGPAGVPVPRVLATGEAGELFDVPFYLMDMVDGVVLTDALSEQLSSDSSPEVMVFALVEAMVQLHGVDWRATSLAAKARPEAFNARHLRLFGRMAQDEHGKTLPAYSALKAWLEAQVPEPSAATIIHNDLRLGNVMWRPQAPPRIAAILDWELAAIGDPLLDLAYLACSIPRDGACHTPVQDLAAALLSPRCPAPDDLVSRYFALSGKVATDISWYQVLVNFKLATLYRYSRLAGHDAYFADESHEARFLAEARRYCHD